MNKIKRNTFSGNLSVAVYYFVLIKFTLIFWIWQCLVTFVFYFAHSTSREPLKNIKSKIIPPYQNSEFSFVCDSLP